MTIGQKVIKTPKYQSEENVAKSKRERTTLAKEAAALVHHMFL